MQHVCGCRLVAQFCRRSAPRRADPTPDLPEDARLGRKGTHTKTTEKERYEKSVAAPGHALFGPCIWSHSTPSTTARNS